MFPRTSTALLFLALTASPGQAATYYVSQQGSDSNSCDAAQGTARTEHKNTIAAALECLSTGDVLYIHEGTYTGLNNVIDSQRFTVPSGTSFSEAITIAGYPGETVTLQPDYNISGIRLTSGAPHHLIFQDFIIDMVRSTPGADASAITLDSAHHIRLERLEVLRSPQFGVLFSGEASYNEMLYCRIHDTGYSGDSETNGHGLYITSSNNLFNGNEVYNNTGYGFHVYKNWGSHADPSNNVLVNNRIYRNGLHGPAAFGIVFAWGDGNRAYNNVIFDNAGGVLVYTDATGTSVQGNTIYGHMTDGIALQYYGPANTVTDNVMYSNGVDIQDYGGSGTPLVANNLTYP